MDTIRVPDRRAAYNTLAARGATFLTPPRPWRQDTLLLSRSGRSLFEISEYRS